MSKNILFILLLVTANVAQAEKDKAHKNNTNITLPTTIEYNRKSSLDLYYDQKNDYLTIKPIMYLKVINFPVINNFEGFNSCFLKCILPEKSLTPITQLNQTDDFENEEAGDESLQNSLDSKALINSKKYGNIVGFLKVKGFYENSGTCLPYKIEYQNYTNNDFLVTICSQNITECKNNACIIEGNTKEIFQKELE